MKLHLTDRIKPEHRELIMAVLIDVFGSCGDFNSQIERAKTYEDVRYSSRYFAESIATTLGAYMGDNEIEELEQTVRRLEGEIEELEDRLEQLLPNDTLIDHWRIEVFNKYCKDMTPMELENTLRAIIPIL